MTDCMAKKNGAVCGLEDGHKGAHVSLAGTVRWDRDLASETPQKARNEQSMMPDPMRDAVKDVSWPVIFKIKTRKYLDFNGVDYPKDSPNPVRQSPAIDLRKKPR